MMARAGEVSEFGLTRWPNFPLMPQKHFSPRCDPAEADGAGAGEGGQSGKGF